jgi:hypothetical protein
MSRSTGRNFRWGAKEPTFAGLPETAVVDPSRPLSLRSGNGSSCPLPDIGGGFGTRGGWTSPPPPSDSLQASDFNHSRASFFSKCEL